MIAASIERTADARGQAAGADALRLGARPWSDAPPSARDALLDWADVAGDALAALDGRGRILHANASFHRSFGLEAPPSRAAADEAVGPSLARFVPLLTAPRLERWIAPASGAPRLHRLLAECESADGDRFLATATLLRIAAPDEEGPTCLVSIRPLDVPRGASEGPATRSSADRVSLGALVDAALRTIGTPGTRRRCRVALHDPDALLEVDPEPVRDALARVLAVACRNAQPPSGIQVRSRLEPSDPADGPDARTRVVVTVADRGPGMTRAAVQRAFDPFGDDPQGGSPRPGLDLAIARHAIERHGGWIELRSVLGVGTEVELWLPSQDGPA